MISFGMDTKSWSALMKYRANTLYPRATRSFVTDVAKFAKQTAIKQSSFRKYVIGRGARRIGIVGLKGMHRVYPYSRRLPVDSGPTKDHEINIQSGEYIRGWYIQTSGQPNGMTAGIGNRAEHAKYLHTIGGTAKMRERNILRGITGVTLSRSFRRRILSYHNDALGQLPV
jgi:hypothetical protein